MKTNQIVYKIVNRGQWEQAEAAGVFEGAEIDLQDGYIHFSSALQAEETAAKHFADQHDLLLVAVQVGPLGDALKWEPSRGGDLFPHLYGTLKTSEVMWVKELPLDADGRHQFPEHWTD